MPRKTKDEEVKKVAKRSKKTDVIEVEEKATSIKNAQKASKISTSKTEKKIADKTATSKKATTKKETSSNAKTSKAKTSASKSTAKKATTKETATKKSTTAKSSTKRTSTKKASTTSKTTKTTKKRTTNKKSKSVATPEYYDLPATYNRTIVKILAQTPSSLFVYWEISEDDRTRLQEKYGESFFQNTKPYLIITNETMHYSFETEINDYANSWYIHIRDSSCKYGVQLVRKNVHYNSSVSDPIINIISSNEIDIPNDHILFDKLGKTVFFRNVKNNHEVAKDISSLSFIHNIGRVYNIYDLYKEIYKNELNGDELGIGLSSSGFSSNFY